MRWVIWAAWAPADFAVHWWMAWIDVANTLLEWPEIFRKGVTDNMRNVNDTQDIIDVLADCWTALRIVRDETPFSVVADIELRLDRPLSALIDDVGQAEDLLRALESSGAIHERG